MAETSPVAALMPASISTSKVCTVIGHGDGGLKVLAVGRDGNQIVPEADLGQIEGVPVQVATQLSVIVTSWAGAVAEGSFSEFMR